MTRLSHLLFVKGITMVISFIYMQNVLGYPLYLYGIRDFSIYNTSQMLPFCYIAYEITILDAINPLHAVYSL